MFAVGVLTAGLTAFYTFRAYFLTFCGEERLPEEAGHHAHESPPVMLVPLVILALGAVFAGIIVEPLTHWFSGLLNEHWLRRPAQELEHRSEARAYAKAAAAEKRAEAKARGYEGEACSECGNFTLVRNGTCLKCDTCGSTTGCS